MVKTRVCASSAGGSGSIPVQGTKIPHAVRPNDNNKTKTPLFSIIAQFSGRTEFLTSLQICGVLFVLPSAFMFFPFSGIPALS